ncbi:MAG: hypothetical protein JJ902_14185 [Roseibium sp.]|nr:hypothetical protein [Roseibium sp.]
MTIDNRLAEVIDSIGTGDFFPSVLDWVSKSEGYDVAFTTRCRHLPNGPEVLSRTEGRYVDNVLDKFQASTFRINPFYWHVISCRTSSVAHAQSLRRNPMSHLKALADDGMPIDPDEREALGYRTWGWPAGMDELGLFFKISEDDTVYLTLARDRPFDMQNSLGIARIQRALPQLAAATRAHLQVIDPCGSEKRNADLTREELDIFRFWTAGKSTREIGERTGLAEPDVRYIMAAVRDRMGYNTLRQAMVHIARLYRLDPSTPA